jgi:hypothetical protein
MQETTCANCGLRYGSHNQDTQRCPNRVDGARWFPNTIAEAIVKARSTTPVYEALQEPSNWNNRNTVMCTTCYAIVPVDFGQAHSEFHESAKKWFAEQVKR